MKPSTAKGSSNSNHDTNLKLGTPKQHKLKTPGPLSSPVTIILTTAPSRVSHGLLCRTSFAWPLFNMLRYGESYSQPHMDLNQKRQVWSSAMLVEIFAIPRASCCVEETHEQVAWICTHLQIVSSQTLKVWSLAQVPSSASSRHVFLYVFNRNSLDV